MTAALALFRTELDASRDDIIAGIREMDEAAPDYRKARDYFEGTAAEYFASQRIARRIGRSGEVHRVNIAKKAVTAVTDRLEMSSVTVPNNDAASKKLQEIMDDNEMGLEMPVVLLKMCEFGDDYVFLAEGDSPGTVTIERSGAMTTRIIYDEERSRVPKYGIKAWPIGSGEKKRQRVNLYYPPEDGAPGRVEKWITLDGTNGTDPGHWTPFHAAGMDGGEPVEPWPLDIERFPIYHFRTERPYGVPMHKGAYGPQAALNKLIATMMATVDQHGYPTRYMLTDGAAEEGDADDSDFGDVFDEETSSDSSADPTSKLKSGPGEAWWLDGVKTTGQYDPANSDAFLKPADFMLRMMATATDMPLHFYDPGGDQPSGESRRTAEGTLTKKVERVQMHAESTARKLYRDALDLAGIAVEAVAIEWTPSASVDDDDFWQTALHKIEAGVPVEQVLLEAGYDATTVTGWLEGNSEQDLKRKVELLAAMAAAARDLGTAVGMGVVPGEMVQEIMGKFIPADEQDPAAPSG